MRVFGTAIVGIVAAAALTFMPSGAQALPVNDQNTGLAAPDVVVDFGSNSFKPTTIITDEFAGQGVEFGSIYVYQTSAIPTPAVAGGHVEAGIPSSGPPLAPGSIFFTSDVTEAVFSWRTAPGTTTFEAYLDGALVETFAASTSDDASTGRFYGFTGIVFDEIRLSISSLNNGFSLDNLQYSTAPVSPIPLPAALPLFGSALGLLGFLGWWRRRTAIA